MQIDRLRARFFEGAPRYRYIETIGRGGMGIVFKAHDLELDEIVAIKLLLPDLGADPDELLARFKREINLNRKIKHPNVARIHDFGTSGEFPYITLEFVPGKDLWTLIHEEGRLAPARVISIIRQIALGTQAAHRLNIIHRDLKSQNVIVDDKGAVAILDFGLARHTLSEQRTHDSILIGTPHYMSPEQALGKTAGTASDIYSIGVIAFEALTGQVPFTGETPIAIGMKHIAEPVPNDLDSVHGVSSELKRIVLKALSKRPEDRFSSAGDLEAELEAELALSQLVEPSGIRKSPLAGPFSLGSPSGKALPLGPAATLPAGIPKQPPTPSPFDLTPYVPRVPKLKTFKSGKVAKVVVPAEGPAPAPAPAPAPSPPPAAKPAPSAKPSPPPPVEATVKEAPKPAVVRAPLVVVASAQSLDRKKLAALLARLGWKTMEASAGPDVLDLFTGNTIDLLVMDVELPEMDGFDVTRILKSQPGMSQVPVVLLAPKLDRSGFAFGIQAGATDLLPRSLAPAALIVRLWRILKGRGVVMPETEPELMEALKDK